MTKINHIIKKQNRDISLKDVHGVTAVNGSEVREKVEVAESGEVCIDPQVITNLHYALQHSEFIHLHPRNAPVQITETQDATTTHTSISPRIVHLMTFLETSVELRQKKSLFSCFSRT